MATETERVYRGIFSSIPEGGSFTIIQQWEGFVHRDDGMITNRCRACLAVNDGVKGEKTFSACTKYTYSRDDLDKSAVELETDNLTESQIEIISSMLDVSVFKKRYVLQGGGLTLDVDIFYDQVHKEWLNAFKVDIEGGETPSEEDVKNILAEHGFVVEAFIPVQEFGKRFNAITRVEQFKGN